MSIRVRLLLSYMAMLLIPLVLFPLVALVIGVIYIGDVQNFYNLDFTPSSVRRLVYRDIMTYEEIKTTAFTNPDKLMDNSYLNQLDQKLSPSHTALVVRKNGTVIYYSKNLNENEEFINQLPEFGSYHENDNHEHYKRSDRYNHFSIQQVDFYFRDHSPGTVFLLTNIGPIGHFIEKFFSALLVALVLMLSIAGIILTYFVSRSLARPIESLKEAALQIKDGNLDFTVENKSRDEIGQLSNAFEEMRCQLKKSIELRLLYEENRKQLISNISHDLKTPVTAIQGYTEGILDGVADSPEKLEKYVKTIHRKTEDLDHLIDELLLFSKLDVRKEPFNFEKIDMKRYLQDCAEELQLGLEEKDIDFSLHIGNKNNPLIVIADREKIKRVINNVIDNAIKYIDKDKGFIKVELYDDDENVIIVVTDNGQGIPAEVLPHIFERFYQADPSRTKGGSGLGLAIAKQIVEEHGGRIWAESNELVGSSVFISLKKASR